MSDTPDNQLPVAVTVKPVLSLIVASVEGDANRVRECAMLIATELELNGKNELAMYIYAQFGLVRTFEVTD